MNLKRILFSSLLLLTLTTLSAQMPKVGVGPIVGTDIGGAMPFPLSAMGESKMRAYPKLHPSLGARFFVNIEKQWFINWDITYKEVELSADAYVENQMANDKGFVTYFTGVVNSRMDFVMLEVPVYARYQFGSTSHSMLFGAYGAWVMKSSFINQPMKGYMGDVPDFVGDGQIINSPADSPAMDFGPMLENWDLGMMFGYENRYYSRLGLGLRVSLGFKDIFGKEKPLAYRMLHIRGSIVLSYDLY